MPFIIEKHSSPTGDGNHLRVVAYRHGVSIEKHSSPTGDGNFLRLTRRNCNRLLRNIAPRQGTETWVHTIWHWCRSFQLRNIAPRQGTETRISDILHIFVFSIEKHSSPTGDGNNGLNQIQDCGYELRNIAPRQGTETMPCKLWLFLVKLRNIAPRQGTETIQ